MKKDVSRMISVLQDGEKYKHFAVFTFKQFRI